MKGARPLTEEEVTKVFNKLGSKFNRYAKRNQLLFMLGVKTGFRISELLSLKVKDVIFNDKVVTHVSVARKNMKGKTQGRTIILHPDVKPLIRKWVEIAKLEPEDWLFWSQKGKVGKDYANRILYKAFELLGMEGRLSSHSMRKTFAARVHDRLGGDIVKTQHALGHKWVTTTQAYLSFNQKDIDAAILT